MKIYTRTGDTGTTGLFGGDRVPKHHLRIEAYGTVDETNAFLGLARDRAAGDVALADLHPVLQRLQRELFVLGADLATPLNAKASVPRIETDHVAALETLIDRFDSQVPPLKHFILPGGSSVATALHITRTVCRRAERCTVALRDREPVNPQAIIYLNRLSDLLFVLARWANRQAGVDEEAWRTASDEGRGTRDEGRGTRDEGRGTNEE